MRRMRKFPALLATLAAIALAVQYTHAQQYPVKPVRIIVPFAAGGPSDLLARTVGQKLNEAWGQSVLVDNRPGVNGILGSDLVAKSPPDGYTLLMATSGTHGINASLIPKLPYDTVRDFAPIARIGYAPYVLVAHPSLPVRSIKALIQLGTARPGEVTSAYGGSASQLAAALFKSMTHVDLLLVPYKGNALATNAVMGGETSLVFGGIAQAAPQVKAGRLRALGVTSTGRSFIMPDVPPISQTVPGFEVSTWYGMVAPAGTPRAIVERINTEIVRILKLPDVRERLAVEAFELPADTPDGFAAVIKAELAKWPKVVKDTGMMTN